MRLQAETRFSFRYTVCPGRGTQEVRERSAKPLRVGSIPTRASNRFPYEVRACCIRNVPCTRRVPRIEELLREGVAFPCFPEVRFQLLLPGFGPGAVVPLRYSNRLMAEKHGYSFDGYAREEKLNRKRVAETVSVAVGNLRDGKEFLTPGSARTPGWVSDSPSKRR